MASFYDPNQLAGYEEDINRLQLPAAPTAGQQGGGNTLPGQAGGISEAILRQLQEMQAASQGGQPQRQLGYDPNYQPTGFLDALRHALKTGLDVAGTSFNKQAGIITPGTVDAQKVDPYTQAMLRVLTGRANEGDVLAQRLAAQLQQGIISQQLQNEKYGQLSDLESQKIGGRKELKGIPQALTPEALANFRSQTRERDTLLPGQQRLNEAKARESEGKAGYWDTTQQMMAQDLGLGGGASPTTAPSSEGEQFEPLPSGAPIGGKGFSQAVIEELRQNGIIVDPEMMAGQSGEGTAPVAPTPAPAVPPTAPAPGKYRREYSPSGMSLKYEPSVEERIAREVPLAKAKKEAGAQVETEKEFKKSEGILRSMKLMADKLFTEEDVKGAWAQGLKNKSMSALGIGLPAAWDETLGAYLSPISRTYGGERGVLTDLDIKRIRGAFPSWMATKQRKDFAFKLLENIKNTALGGGTIEDIEPYIAALESGQAVDETPSRGGAPVMPPQLQGSGRANPEGQVLQPSPTAQELYQRYQQRKQRIQ